MRILAVCSANLVRSPVAEAAWQRWADRRGRADVHVASAGITAADGMPVPGEVKVAAADLGLDLSDHRSRVVTPEDLMTSGLVLTMTEDQRTSMQHARPSATSRTFTLREFARLVGGLTAVPRGASLEDVVLLAHRQRARQARPDGPEDVNDVYGGRPKDYARCAAEIVGLVDSVTSRLP